MRCLLLITIFFCFFLPYDHTNHSSVTSFAFWFLNSGFPVNGRSGVRLHAMWELHRLYENSITSQEKPPQRPRKGKPTKLSTDLRRKGQNFSAIHTLMR